MLVSRKPTNSKTLFQHSKENILKLPNSYHVVGSSETLEQMKIADGIIMCINY